MCSKPNNVTRCLHEIDRDHQPEIIRFNIKDNSVIIYNAGIAIYHFQLIKVAERKLRKLIKPNQKLYFCPWILSGIE